MVCCAGGTCEMGGGLGGPLVNEILWCVGACWTKGNRVLGGRGESEHVHVPLWCVE